MTTTYTVQITYANGMETIHIVYKAEDIKANHDYLTVITEATRIIRRKQRASCNYRQVKAIEILTVARDMIVSDA